MEERRRFVRLDTRLEMLYTLLPKGAPLRAVTKDVSGGGICLFADRELAPGTQLDLAVKLPDRKDPVRAVAEVVWSEAYETIGKTRRDRSVEIGVKFVKIAKPDQESLLQHVILEMKSSRPPGQSKPAAARPGDGERRAGGAGNDSQRGAGSRPAP